jgi:hypothetical protein
MRVRGLGVVRVGALLCFGLCVPAVAQDKAEAVPGPSDADMKKIMEAMTPGAAHKHLEKLVGDFTFNNKMWMDPAAPPTESGGTMHGEMILGGRYVHTVWKGEFMGMPFEGHGTDGYDNLMRQYVSSWVDNMGTGILHSKGTCSGNVCLSVGDMIDPMTEQRVTVRSVSTWNEDGTMKMEMFAKDRSGNETKTMEMLVKKKG